MAARGAFGSKIGFILAAAGSAVGLGNIWKFPFEVEAGGGAAFVLLYLIFCILLCFPVMVTEVAIGRKTDKNAIGAFHALGFSRWSFVGKLGVLAAFVILSFYNVVAGWALGYCIEMARGHFDIGSKFGDYVADVKTVGIYAVIFMVVTACIVSRGVSGGIEKMAKILMPALIVMILGLVVYSFTLPHAMTGVTYYLVPDFSELNLRVIGGALRQAFFSLSLGMGTLITYGSYLSSRENIISCAAYITIFDVGIAFIAGLMIFPLAAYSTGGDMSNIQGGAGLIFATLPQVFQSLGPALGMLIGAFFFLLLSFAALTSTVSLLEVPVSYAVDEYGIKRNRAVILTATLIFIAGLPALVGNGYSAFFSNFITYVGADKPTGFITFSGHLADIMLLLGGCLIMFFAGYVWKAQNLDGELAKGNPTYEGSLVQSFLNFSIKYFCPIILAVLFFLVVLSNFFGMHLIN